MKACIIQFDHLISLNSGRFQNKVFPHNRQLVLFNQFLTVRTQISQNNIIMNSFRSGISFSLSKHMQKMLQEAKEQT